jgi:hypothetical protein
VERRSYTFDRHHFFLPASLLHRDDPYNWIMSRLEPESGIWYTVCWVVLLARLWSRRLHHGAWKHLKLDDVLICLAMVRMFNTIDHHSELTACLDYNDYPHGRHAHHRTHEQQPYRARCRCHDVLPIGNRRENIWIQAGLGSGADAMLHNLAGQGMPAFDVLPHDVRIILSHSVDVQSNANATRRALLPQHKIVVVVAAYTALGFVSIDSPLFTSEVSNTRNRWSWKFYILAFGVDPSTNTGPYLPHPRSAQLQQTISSRMRS